MISQIRVGIFLPFLLATFFLNFLFFNEKVFERVNHSLIQQSFHSTVWFFYFAAIITLSFFSFKLLQWALEPKYIRGGSWPFYFIHWCMTILTIQISIGFYLKLNLGYELLLTHPRFDKSSLTPLFTALLMSTASACVLTTLYKWMSPILSKIDYTKLQVSIIEFSERLSEEQIRLKTNEARSDKLNQDLFEIVERLKSEVRANLPFERNKGKSNLGREILFNAKILTEFLEEIKFTKSFGDINYFLSDIRGGAVTEETLEAKTFLKDLKIRLSGT